MNCKKHIDFLAHYEMENEMRYMITLPKRGTADNQTLIDKYTIKKRILAVTITVLII